MSNRRIFLLILLIVPFVLFIGSLIYPIHQGDQYNWVEISALVIGIPILILNFWEWQYTEIVDELFFKK